MATTWAASTAMEHFDEPLDVNDVPEFHAGRILVLLLHCGRGRGGEVSGRTKLAKLDFFVRYPRFLEAAVARLRSEGKDILPYDAGAERVEAGMIRYRFGPWDHRFYNLLALLYGRGLISISGSVETYRLTKDGRAIAERLQLDPSFAAIVERCSVAATAFAGMRGTALKRFVYDTFDEEVAALPRGSIIREPDSRGH